MKNKKLMMFVIIGLLAYFAYLVISQQRLIYSKSMEIKNIEAQIEKEQKNNDKLKKIKENINSDEYIEKIAREKLGMVRNGERVFVDVNK